MKISILSSLIGAQVACGCGGSMPVPTQRLADAQSAARSARELGAEHQPAARLSLELAQSQIARAELAIAKGENERADGLLFRARADAELAVAQAREKAAKRDVGVAVDEAVSQKTVNAGQGAVK